MKKNLTLWLAAAVAGMASCAKIDDLSDFNELKGLKIVSHWPPAMELSGAQVEGDVVYIGVDFGEYLFPLTLHAQPLFDGEIDMISGLDFSQELVFETSESEKSFYVMAPSGMPRAYKIKPRVTPLEKNVALSRSFTLKGQEPAGMLISEEGVVINLTQEGERRDTLKIFTVNGAYPVGITPQFSIAATSHFGEITAPDGTVHPFNNGNTPLLFENAEAVYKLQVISESGLDNIWNIVMCHTPSVSGNDGVSTFEQREGSDIDPRNFSALPQGYDPSVVDEIFVDNSIEDIVLVLKGNITFPIEMEMQFSKLEGVQAIDLEKSAATQSASSETFTVTLAGWNDVKTFYLLDTDACVSRLWQISLKEWKASDCEVLSFGYTYTVATVSSRPSCTLETDQTVIYPTGDIYLYMSALNSATSSSWRLTLENLQINVSEGATLGTLPSFVWSGNNSYLTSKEFKVIAQDGTEKMWRVNIRDMRSHTPSAACALTDFEIARYAPNYAVFDGFEPVTMDVAQRTITLKLSDDDGIYPLSVWPRCEISPFAAITSQNGGVDPLVFENADSEQTLTVVAEDGTTTSDWTLKLLPPVREVQANVEGFNVTSMSGQLKQVTKNEEKGTIRIWLGAAPAFPLNITYIMTVSKKSTASIPLRGTFTVNSYQDIQSFTVTAQDGSKRDWKILVVYEPQLTNGSLDTWSGSGYSKAPVGWATANTSVLAGLITTIGTTEIAGNPSSGSAAQIETKSTLGNLASGSLFLGTFDNGNAMTYGTSDPIRLTFFGLPLSTSGKILGVQFDVTYKPGAEFISGTNRELGSCVVELVKPIPGQEGASFVYHGADATGTQHNLNTAEPVAHAQAVMGNSSGTSWNGLDITVVSQTVWTTVQLLFNYPGGVMPYFTHLHLVFGSSAQGDKFTGVSGSTLKVDNIKILYEEE